MNTFIVLMLFMNTFLGYRKTVSRGKSSWRHEHLGKDVGRKTQKIWELKLGF